MNERYLVDPDVLEVKRGRLHRNFIDDSASEEDEKPKSESEGPAEDIENSSGPEEDFEDDDASVLDDFLVKEERRVRPSNIPVLPSVPVQRMHPIVHPGDTHFLTGRRFLGKRPWTLFDFLTFSLTYSVQHHWIFDSTCRQGQQSDSGRGVSRLV